MERAQGTLDQYIKSGEVSEWWEPGKAFEYLVMRMFELDQAKVTYAFPVHFEEDPIEEIDGVVHLDSLSCIVECKNQSNPVNPTPVSKLRNQLLRRPNHTIALLFSTSGFTSPAYIIANFMMPQTILLWNTDEIDYLFENRSICNELISKFRHSVKTGMAYYNIKRDQRL